jgi:hypothetical protein
MDKLQKPSVVALAGVAGPGSAAEVAVISSLVEHHEFGHAFGRDHLGSLDAHGRFQQRVISVPNRAGPTPEPMFVTTGNLGGLYLVRRAAGAAGQWEVVDLLAGLVMRDRKPPRVQAFGVGVSESDDRITLAVALAVDPPISPPRVGSRLFIAADLCSRTTDFTKLAAGPWVDCGERDSSFVDGIRVIETRGRGWGALLSVQQLDGQGAFLWLAADAPRDLASLPIITPPVRLKQVLDFEVGRHPLLGQGWYGLGEADEGRVLYFNEFPTWEGSIPQSRKQIYAAPADAVVLTRGAVRPQRGKTRITGTDLFLGGAGVHLLAVEEQAKGDRATFVPVLAAADAPDVADVVLSSAGDGARTIWAVTVGGQLAYAEEAAGGRWSAPLVLRTDVEEVVAVGGDGTDLRSALVLVYTGGAAGLLVKDAETGAWTEEAMTVRTTDRSVRTLCHATTVRVLGAASIPCARMPVRVRASVATSASINGLPVLLGPGRDVLCQTDADGGLVILDRAQSLVTATYRLTIGESAQCVDIDPSVTLRAGLRDVTGEQLRATRVARPDGEPGGLLIPAGTEPALVDMIAVALDHTLRATLPDPGVPRVEVRPIDAPYRSTQVAAQIGHGTIWTIEQSGAQILVKIGDAARSVLDSLHGAIDVVSHRAAEIFQSVNRGLHKMTAVVFEKIEGALQVVLKTGDQLVRFVLRAWHDCAGILDWLWAKVKVGWNRLAEWARFTFSWADIKRTRRMLADLAFNALDHIGESLDAMAARVDDGVAHVERTLAAWRPAPGQSLPAPGLPDSQRLSTLGQQHSRPYSDAIEQMRSAPAFKWVFDLLGSLTSAGERLIRIEGLTFDELAGNAALNFVEGTLKDLRDAAIRTWGALRSDIVRVYSTRFPDGHVRPPTMHDLSWEVVQHILASVGADLVTGFLQALAGFVKRVLQLGKDLGGAARAILGARIHFPFLSDVMRVVDGSPHDVSFRLIDAAALLLAIPATVTYKTLFGAAPFADEPAPRFPLDVASRRGEGKPLIKHVSWLGSLVAAVVKWGITGNRAIQAAIACGAGPGVTVDPLGGTIVNSLTCTFSFIGVVCQGFAVRQGNGTAVLLIEGVMTEISVASFFRVVLTTVLYHRNAGEEAAAKALRESVRKLSGVFDILDAGAKLVLRPISYGLMLDQIRRGTAADKPEQVIDETLAFIDALASNSCIALIGASTLVADPYDKTGLLIGGLMGRQLAMVVNVARTIVGEHQDYVIRHASS